MRLGHLVVGKIVGLDAALVHRPQQVGGLAAVMDFDADEDVRDPGVGVPVIEFGDAALAEQCAELAEAARPFGDRDRQDRFALLAELGAFGDEAQPVEIHVGPGGDRHKRSVLRAMSLAVGLHPGDGQRARGLEDRARVLEGVLDRGTDRVGVDQHHLVDQLAAASHRRRIDGLDADDPDLGPHALDVGRDPCDQSAAADRHEDRIGRTLVLTENLHADRALPCDHVEVVVRVHEYRAARPSESDRLGVGIAVRVSVEQYFRPTALHRVNLDRRRGHRHDDPCRAAQSLSRKRHPLSMIPGGGSYDPTRAFPGGQVRHPVVRAAQLEREHRLLILALQQHRIAEPHRQRRGNLERRFDCDVVNLGRQDLLEIVDRHRIQAREGRNAGAPSVAETLHGPKTATP